ncbi:hypothetical protein ENBRE01_2269 [Enteropsectra breve]|nr:hypothetical protein ENBRE01_2269 [Enteropsectra breve]
MNFELVTVLITYSLCTAAERENSKRAQDLHNKHEDSHENQSNGDLRGFQSELSQKNKAEAHKMEEELNLYVNDLEKQFESIRDKYFSECSDLFDTIRHHDSLIKRAVKVLDTEDFNKINTRERCDEYEKFVNELKRTLEMLSKLYGSKTKLIHNLWSLCDDDFTRNSIILVDNFKNSANTDFTIFKELCSKGKGLLNELWERNDSILEKIQPAEVNKKFEPIRKSIEDYWKSLDIVDSSSNNDSQPKNINNENADE